MELSTRRLILRRWREEDLAPYARLCADPEVMRFIGDGATLDEEAAAGQIARFEEAWRYGFGLWAVQPRDTEDFVGFAGLSQPFFLPEVLPAVELGWRFARHQWGRGFAQESGAAALVFGFSTLSLHRIIGIVAQATRPRETRWRSWAARSSGARTTPPEAGPCGCTRSTDLRAVDYAE